MPAGNDAQNALNELADKFGQGTGRAEDLIQANRTRFAGLLGAAQLKQVDAEATEELKEADVAKSAGVDGDDLLGYTVRGDTVVYSYVDHDNGGRVEKGAILADSVGKAASTAEKEAAKAADPEAEAPKKKASSKKS